MPTALQPHQRDAVSKFGKSRSLIAFHGLGSGKTLTSLAAGAAVPGNKLVVLPASLEGNYIKEIEKHKYPRKDFKLLSYERFRKDPGLYIERFKPSMLITDEYHRSKDPGNLTGTALRNARGKVPHFMGLTGTLAQNHPAEIGELLHTATGEPILGKNTQEFKDRYIEEKVVSPGLLRRVFSGAKPGKVEVGRNLDDFRERVAPYVHTFAGDDEYQKHVPTVALETRSVEMDPEQQRHYNFVFGNLPPWAQYKVRKGLPPSKSESKNLNAFLQGARQVSNTAQGFGAKTTSPKLSAVLNDIRHGIESDPNFKSVVYSQYLDSGITPLSEGLEKLNIPHGSFTGAQTQKERNRMVSDYNEGRLKALLLSPAGGEGLDLRGTKHMGVLEPAWNPEKIKQAIGRTARYKSHEHLPQNERNVRVVSYRSIPRLTAADRMMRFFNKKHTRLGVDEYIAARAAEKDALNQQFTDALKGAGAQ